MLEDYSNPKEVERKAKRYGVKVFRSTRRDKKYMVYHNKWIHFGAMGYEDYTKHHNKTRRKNYLTRTKGMLGDWKNNRYSANNLSRNILW